MTTTNETSNTVQKCYELTYRQTRDLLNFRVKTTSFMTEIGYETSLVHYNRDVSVSEQINLVSREQQTNILLKGAKDYLLMEMPKCIDQNEECNNSSEYKYPLHIPVYETRLSIKDYNIGLSLPFDITDFYTKLMMHTLKDRRKQLLNEFSKTKIEINGTYELIGNRLPLKVAIRSEKNEDINESLSSYLDQLNKTGRLVIALISDEMKKHEISTQIKFDRNSYAIIGHNYSFNMSVVDNIEVRVVLGIAKTGDKKFDRYLIRFYVKPLYDITLCNINNHNSELDFEHDSFDKKCQEIMTAQLPETNNVSDYKHIFIMYKNFKQEQMKEDMESKNLSMFHGIFDAGCNSVETWGIVKEKATRSYNPMIISRTTAYKPIQASYSGITDSIKTSDMVAVQSADRLITGSDTIEGVNYLPLVSLSAFAFIFIVIIGIFWVLRRKGFGYRAMRSRRNMANEQCL